MSSFCCDSLYGILKYEWDQNSLFLLVWNLEGLRGVTNLYWVFVRSVFCKICSKGFDFSFRLLSKALIIIGTILFFYVFEKGDAKWFSLLAFFLLDFRNLGKEKAFASTNASDDRGDFLWERKYIYLYMKKS
jgi:hypothetical protein